MGRDISMFSMFSVVGRVGAMKQLELLKKLALPKRNLVLCIGGRGDWLPIS